MKLQQSKSKRRRGVVLTPVGLQRLQDAIFSWEIKHNKGDRLTLEQLSNQINVSTKTLSRLWSLSTSVDHKTLKLCFSAFNLEIEKQDYTFLSEDYETKISDLITINSSLKAKNLSQLSSESTANNWSYPHGNLPLDSPFYIERPPTEELIYRELTKLGCVIRIRSPRQMGKSSLVLRLLAFANTQEYHTVNLKFNQIDGHCLTNLNHLLRCVCWQIAKQLNINPNLDETWDEEVGCKLSCSLYLQNYILKQCKNPLVLVLSDVDCFFDYPYIAQEFFSLLRSWGEEARQNHNWQKLKLVVVYSTEKCIAFDLNHSSFNIGLPILLHEFTQKQVEELARRYGIEWTSGRESSQLISLVGGHPALVQLALYHLSSGAMTLSELIAEAITNGGIYRHHLQQHWAKLRTNLHLIKLYTEIISGKEGIVIDPMDTYQLESLGLITFVGDRILPRCELYSSYFAKQLSIVAP